MPKFRILFICMGNICRSPAAEGVMQHFVQKNGLTDKIECDSAGTIGFHAGEPADHRMRLTAKARGIELTSISRQIKSEDLEDFDLIITMDDENYFNVKKYDRNNSYAHKIKPFCDYCKEFSEKEVPDPYYGGDQGFEHVLNMLEDGCLVLCEELKAKL